MISIAIDGPAGVGKSSTAKIVAKKLEFSYLDTGAFYRVISYYLLTNDIDYNSKDEIGEALKNIKIDFEVSKNFQTMFLFGEDITEEIRGEDISIVASEISKLAVVREFLLTFQQKFAQDNNVVMDGRDIGTVVLPNADVKLFLTASPHARATRRFNQLKRRGKKANFNDILKSLKRRDKNDSTRAEAPLVAAPDAVVIDSTKLEMHTAIDQIFDVISEKLGIVIEKKERQHEQT